MPPNLLRLESCLADYTIKATISGVTVLTQNRFRKRYTGSKSHAIDINGKLWVNANDLKKEMGVVPRRTGKKKPPGPPDGNEEIAALNRKFMEELPPHEREFLTNLPKFSTTAESPKKKAYKIHKREVRQRLLGMINTKAGKKELYFWTVTFPKGTQDNIAYQAFNTWLTVLRSKDKQGRRFLKNYLWVAERQEIGTVHFHIAIPHKMPVAIANGAMRTILRTFSSRGIIPFSIAQCKRYNGVDIAKNRNTKRVTNFAIKKGARALITYLTKYLTKNDAEFSHLAWHNSRGFSALFTGITFTSAQFKKLGVRRFNPDSKEWETVSFMECLKPAPWGYVDREVFDRETGQLKTVQERVQIWDVRTEYFWFQPWNAFGMPENLMSHMGDVNSYLQELTAKN